MKLSHTLSLFCASTCLFTSVLSVQAAKLPDTPAIKAAVQLEDAFNAVAEHVKDSVVVITNLQNRNGMMMNEQVPFDFEDFFFHPYMQPRRQFNRRPRPNQVAPVNTGSGAIISKDGYIITNCHVIDNCEFLRVKLADGTIFDNQKNTDEVKIIGIDKESDLAVIQISSKDKKEFKALDFGDSDALKVGQWAIAVGAPHQLEQSVTIGHVSQIGRHNPGISVFNNYIQTDASLNPGNSGGPLLNIYGEIIGINEFIQTDGMSHGNIGLGFAIASNVVKAIADDLIKNGEVARPFIGIQMQNLTDELKPQFNVEHGVIVAEVISGEAAEKAGLKAGDVIISINGQEIKNSQEMLTAITNYKPGDKLQLKVVRGDDTMDVNLEAGKRALADNTFKGRKPSQADSSFFDKLGLSLAVKEGRLVIQDIDPDGAVGSSQNIANTLQVGDIICDVNRHPVNSINDVKDALRFTRNNTVIMLIERNNRGRSSRLYIAIPLD